MHHWATTQYPTHGCRATMVGAPRSGPRARHDQPAICRCRFLAGRDSKRAAPWSSTWGRPVPSGSSAAVVQDGEHSGRDAEVVTTVGGEPETRLAGTTRLDGAELTAVVDGEGGGVLFRVRLEPEHPHDLLPRRLRIRRGSSFGGGRWAWQLAVSGRNALRLNEWRCRRFAAQALDIAWRRDFLHSCQPGEAERS